jgi:pilus assembly protein CpaC
LLVALVAPVCLSSAALSAQAPLISIDVSEGRLLTLSSAATSVFLADPQIADVQVPQPNKIFIFGKKAGRTSLIALGENGQQLASYSVEVRVSTEVGQHALSGNPGTAGLQVVGRDTGPSLHGTVADPATASAATATLQSFTAGTTPVDATQLNIGSSAQVLLRVWVGQVARTVTKDLGFDWSAGVFPGLGSLGIATGRTAVTPGVIGGLEPGSTLNLGSDYGSIVAGLNVHGNGGSVVIDALAQEGLVTTLAEPTLIAMSGESASFLAGGQFPIPVVQSAATGGTASSITIEYEQYGVSLGFTPTVLASNRINLKVRPEVSELSAEGQVTLNGFVVPGLTVRRANTTVELGSGQSFAIAGMLQNTTSTTIQKYPGLGDLPILGTMFRSSNFQHGETELVIIVTPYLVKPVDDPNRLKLATDGISPPSDLERIYRQRIAIGQSGTPGGADTPANSVSVLTGPRLAGDAGFDLE